MPITRYATEVIENLAGLPDYPADFAAAVAANTVSEEDNVRAVLAKIELGEGDAAIVYLTDARSSDAVAAVELPDDGQRPGHLCRRRRRAPRASRELASDFLAFLTGPEAQAVLASYGFLPPPEG